MALVVKDRVQETSTTTGTGAFTLLGAVTGFQTFSSAIGNTNTTYYAIQNGAEWEVGIGTVGAGTLTRDTVLESSNAGALVNFSAGSKFVFCTYPAEKSVYYDASNNVNIDITGNAATVTNGLYTTDIGSTVQAYDADTTKNDVANTFTANQVISVTDNTNAALRVTQLGTGNALVVEDSANPDSTPFVIDANGNVGIGTSSPSNTLAVNGSGRFYGSYTEDTTNIGVHAGYINSTPRIGFFNGTAAQNWQIDNSSGQFRWFTPGTVQMAISSTGNLSFNSGYGSAATAYGCRAWVNFNGTGTVAIRDSGNVSSITDNGTGNYTVNFSTSLVDANYATVLGCRNDQASNGDMSCNITYGTTPATNNVRVWTARYGSGAIDSAYVNVAIFR